LSVESAPIRAVINAVHNYVFEFYTLITMTSLQFTQDWGLSYTRGMHRLTATVNTDL